MADKNDSADKTEKPTPKRLQDARKKGDVAKSREITSTTLLIAWLVLAFIAMWFAGSQMAKLVDASMIAMQQPFANAVRDLGWQSLYVLCLLTLLFLVPAALIGLFTEFMQAGPILSFEKLKPKMSHINPAEGLKRMFNLDNLFEVVKLVIKTALLLTITLLVLRGSLGTIVNIHAGSPAALGAALEAVTMQLIAATAVIFFFVAVLDAVYQRHSFTKKMRMSRRDILQELKDSEGDPYVKARRKQLHQEWAQRNSVEAARRAKALVTNPEHLAVALDYDDEHPIPTVIAKGADQLAFEMRQAAQEAGVPVLRQVDLARALYERVEVEQMVPADLFDAVAQVVLWAREQSASEDADEVSN